ncbi:MAG: ABC transporter permease [Deltaproteobacteria bacterium]|nr:ABC transporter permease [Deltaproteobacteria bacterium]
MSRLFTLAFLAQAVRIALPYLAASMGGIWSERAGVPNVALEGTILVAALGAVAGTTLTGSAWLGLIVGLLAGVLLQIVHALVVLIGRANAIVSGLALNLLAAGGTRFLLRALYDSSSNSPAIPGLAPPASTSLLRATVLDPTTWMVAAVVVGTIVALERTRLGLRVRAVGEHPEAAASVGVPVARTRAVALAITGATAGLAGVWLAFDQRQFSSGMSGGRGFIALATVVIAGWRPLPAVGFALLFGVAEAAQIVLQDQNVVAHQVVQALPYVLTLVVLAGWVRRARPPAALGRP